MGAGILAATAAGWYPDAMQAAQAMTGTAERFTPNNKVKKIYDDLFEVYRGVFPALQTSVDRLTELTRG